MGIVLNGNKLFFELSEETLTSMTLFYTGKSKTKKPIKDIPRCLLHTLFRPFEILEQIISDYCSVIETPQNTEFVLRINLPDNTFKVYKGYLRTNGDKFTYLAHIDRNHSIDFPLDLFYKKVHQK